MSTTLSIQLFEKYKREEKQDKEIAKRKRIYEKQLEKRKDSMSSIIDRNTMYYQARLTMQSEKKLARETKRKQSKLDNDIRAILGKKEVKKKVKVTPVKQTAYKLACLYAKLSRCDEDMMLILFDTGERVHRKEAQGGHFYPKGKYPHMALMTTNIFPISARGNRQQGDNIGYERSDAVVRELGQKTYDYLKEYSTDKTDKLQVRDHAYYEDKVTVFTRLIRGECERLPITFKEVTMGIIITKSKYIINESGTILL